MRILGSVPQTELLLIESGQPNSDVEIIFVHGLDGDPISTWQLDKDPSWKSWIQENISTCNIWSLQYRLRSTNWQGGSMPLTDRAVNVLAELHSTLPNESPIVFICHSYGGLLVKQLLRSARDVATEFSSINTRTRGIVFFGTPHTGSGLAVYMKAIPNIIRSSEAIDELKYNNSVLRDLNGWFRNNSSKFVVGSFFESIDTFGFRVVDENSADLGKVGVVPIGIDTNHIDICKPRRFDLRVKRVIDLIQRVRYEKSLSTDIVSAPNMEIARNIENNDSPKTIFISEKVKKNKKRSWGESLLFFVMVFNGMVWGAIIAPHFLTWMTLVLNKITKTLQ